MKKLLIAATLATLPMLALAEGPYGGADIGYARVDTKAPETAQYLANLAGETVSYTYDRAAVVGRAFAGYQFNENIALEAGYFSTGDLSNKYTSASGAATEDYRGRGGDLSFLLRPSVTSGMNNAFLRLGGHYSEVDGDASVRFSTTTYSLTGSGNANQTGTGFLVGAGYDLPIDKNIAGRFGYSFYNQLGGLSGADAHVLTVGLKFGGF
jgi:opacity protein-like surface antigen